MEPELDSVVESEVTSVSNTNYIEKSDEKQESVKKKRKTGYETHRLTDESLCNFLEDAFNRGVPSACKKINLPLSTGYYLAKKWDANVGFSSVQRKKSGPPAGKHIKLTDDIQEYVIAELKENNTLSGTTLTSMIKQKFNISVSKSTVNAFLASNGYSYKAATTEDVVRNTDVLINERYLFAVKMLEEGFCPDDPSSIIYWDVTHFETCIVATKARALIGEPAVVAKGHRGVYIPVHESQKKRQSKPTQYIHNNNITKEINFTEDDPSQFTGQKANSLSLCCAMTGKEILLARSQFRHFTSEDMVQFFHELLDKLEDCYPKKGFVFIGDNENVHAKAMELFLQPKYHHHTFIPNPHYSPFLNAIEYLFNQLKCEVKGPQHKSLGDLVLAVQKSFETVQPHHLHNYHKTVKAYLLQCLKKEQIHAWRTNLEDKNLGEKIIKQKWDVKHKSIYATEREIMGKPMNRDNTKGNEPKKDKSVMVLNGTMIDMYK